MRDRFPTVQMPSNELIGSSLALIRQLADAEGITITSDGPRSGLLILLPTFIAGSNLRIRWSQPRAFVTETGHAEATWTITDRMFGTLTGSVIIDRDSGEHEFGIAGTAVIAAKPFTSGRALTHLIDQLRADANLSRFQLLTALEPFVTRMVGFASAQIALEIAEYQGAPGVPTAIDRHEQEQVVSNVLFGYSSDTELTSVAIRLLERAAGDLDAAVGDTRHYFGVNLNSAIETAVRRQIGDPHIGRNVRALAASLGTRDVDTLLDAMRRHKPGTPIGAARIQAALDFAPSLQAEQFSLDYTYDESGSTLLDRIVA